MPIPKSSTPALLLTMVRSFVPLRRTAAMRFSGMPHSPKPPMRMVAPSRSFSIPASAEAMRLSIPCSEAFGGSLLHSAQNSEGGHTGHSCGRSRSDARRLKTAQKLVQFIGCIEVALKLARGELLAKFIEAAREKIERCGQNFLIR